ncbi:MAG TPA: biopolymer transporter ExbD [Bryobacteraceae bacterium]|nr:biopolymer transporter ExbD [Bryobacteraceae bacterium]
MAFQMNGGSGGRRSRGLPAMAEINVTPFVDVALVLLIIFMITAHVMESGLSIDVPKTKTVESSTKELPVVQVTKTGELYLGNEPVNVNRLVDEIHTKYPGQQAVYIRADAQTQFGTIAYVMSELGNAKLAIQVVTQPDDRGRGR